jgi:hypothetical protein
MRSLWETYIDNINRVIAITGDFYLVTICKYFLKFDYINQIVFHVLI